MQKVDNVCENRDECCGCSACEAICPSSAISMETDQEGFLYSVVNNDKCVGCQLCRRVCPVIEMD